MKTSVGALDNVKIVEVTNLNNTIKKLKDNGVWGILNNIVVSEEAPAEETLWIDPTGDSEINKEGNLTNIR